MIIFKYRCINLEIDNENQVAGFLVELGDQWDDLMIYEVNRKEEVLHNSTVVFGTHYLTITLNDDVCRIANFNSKIRTAINNR